jgi:hypothetical protein
VIPATAAFAAYAFDPDSPLAVDALDSVDDQLGDCDERQAVVVAVAILLAAIRAENPEAWALIVGLREVGRGSNAIGKRPETVMWCDATA